MSTTVKVKFPEGLSAVAAGGTQYAPLKNDRIVEVPVEIRDHFLAFGCLVVSENIPAEEPEVPQKDPAGEKDPAAKPVPAPATKSASIEVADVAPAADPKK
jgi:hypothetical protein